MNLLDYEIIGDKFRITRQWEVLRGCGLLGQWNKVNVTSDGYPAIYKASDTWSPYTTYTPYTNMGSPLWIINLQGNDIRRDQEMVPLRDNKAQIIGVLETFSQIPIQQLETGIGPLEYVQIPYNPIAGGPITIIGGLTPSSIRDIIREIDHEWHDAGTHRIKLATKNLDQVQDALKTIKTNIETLFYQEQGITL